MRETWLKISGNRTDVPNEIMLAKYDEYGPVCIGACKHYNPIKVQYTIAAWWQAGALPENVVKWIQDHYGYECHRPGAIDGAIVWTTKSDFVIANPDPLRVDYESTTKVLSSLHLLRRSIESNDTVKELLVRYRDDPVLRLGQDVDKMFMYMIPSLVKVDIYRYFSKEIK